MRLPPKVPASLAGRSGWCGQRDVVAPGLPAEFLAGGIDELMISHVAAANEAEELAALAEVLAG